MQLVDGIVRRSSEQLSESTGLLQDILKAAADQQARCLLCCAVGAKSWTWNGAKIDSRTCSGGEIDRWACTGLLRLATRCLTPLPAVSVCTCLQTGEWELPLRPDKLDAMRAVMAANASGLDESLLASCYSWMRKASEDKLGGESAAAFYLAAAAAAAPPAPGCSKSQQGQADGEGRAGVRHSMGTVVR